MHLGGRPLHQKRHSTGNPRIHKHAICMSIIFLVSSGWSNTLSCEWLQWWFNNNVITYLCKPFSCSIPNLLMTYKGESSMVANHGMIRREGFTTHLMTRSVGQYPAIMQMHCIPKFTFIQMETLHGHAVGEQHEQLRICNTIEILVSCEWLIQRNYVIDSYGYNIIGIHSIIICIIWIMIGSSYALDIILNWNKLMIETAN